MPRFIDTRGRSTHAISICDRCKRKFPYDELSPDRNSPGLMVCRDDNDERDPYRLAPRKTEKISLRYPRPDTPFLSSRPYTGATVGKAVVGIAIVGTP